MLIDATAVVESTCDLWVYSDLDVWAVMDEISKGKQIAKIMVRRENGIYAAYTGTRVIQAHRMMGIKDIDVIVRQVEDDDAMARSYRDVKDTVNGVVSMVRVYTLFQPKYFQRTIAKLLDDHLHTVNRNCLLIRYLHPSLIPYLCRGKATSNTAIPVTSAMVLTRVDHASQLEIHAGMCRIPHGSSTVTYVRDEVNRRGPPARRPTENDDGGYREDMDNVKQHVDGAVINIAMKYNMDIPTARGYLMELLDMEP